MRISLRQLTALLGLGMFILEFGASQAVASTIESVQILDTSVKVDSPPQMISFYQPAAPYFEENEEDVGSLWIKVLVGRRGWVKDVALLNPSRIEVIDDWAIEAAYKNKFVPMTHKGRTIEVWVSYRFDFQSGNEPKKGRLYFGSIRGPQLPFKLQSVKKRDFAVPTKLPNMEFPLNAKSLSLGNVYVVWVKVLVEKNGEPKEVKIVFCLAKDVGFEDAAIEATMKSAFVPWKRRGKSKAHWLYHSVIFLDPDAIVPTDAEIFDKIKSDTGNKTLIID